MKKIWWILLLALFLVGCGKEKSLETIGDVQDTPVIVTMQQPLVQLPPQMSTPVLESEESGKLFLCDDYSVTLQTVSGGDLSETIRNATGMNIEDLQILQTQNDDIKCYQWVWAANGENGIQVGRGCVLDDGAYHYVLTALADEEVSGKVQSAWNEIFTSFQVIPELEEINTGS